MKLNHLVLLGALMTSSAACLAHKDRIITFSQQGMMTEIPAEFGPARLEVEFAARGARHPVDGVTLSLGAHVTSLPACIVALLPSRQMAQLRAKASWYHDESRTLPYYLGIDFAAPGAGVARGRGTQVDMLFNLRSAKLISIRKVTVDAGDGSQRWDSMHLGRRCSAQELDAVFDPAIPLNAR
ncbi:hypothetical protein [Massilia antarctica]|uniref:hypothetical protein n=1 Tax=Massilia antarctica TaxID=2765360 RepID=UPI0011AF793D|nr:hypothetical protein [Massilia sp. H27-R4]MCY0914113.1 hypothetical protein [Massilia sp. H27-R4]